MPILSCFSKNVHRKKCAALVLAAALAFGWAMPAAAVGYDPSATYAVQAQSAYVVNTDTNVIIYEKDSRAQVKAGGLTKLMTIALVMANYEDSLDTTIITQPRAISDYVRGTDHADFRIGESMPLREALYAMLLRNANEVAMSVAYTLSGGDLTGWYTQMNSLSQKIGATDSVWTDACGIDDGNLTTARDMYLILRYLMDFDAFVQAAGTYSTTLPSNPRYSDGAPIQSHNKMLSKSAGGKLYRSAIRGGKVDVAGYERDTGTQSAVSWATQDGATYIFSIMNSPDSCDTNGYAARRPALFETAQLLDWAYANFAIQAALDTTQPICEVPVAWSGETDSLKLYPADDLKTILPAASDATVTQKRFSLPEQVYAPVKQGDVVGTVTLLLAGEPIGTVELLAGQDVHRNSILYGVAQLQNFFTGTYFKTVILLSLLCIAAYVAVFLRQAARDRHTDRIWRR